VREIKELIRHCSRRTTEFKEYIAQGSDYLDFVALEEKDLIFINEGKTEFQPPERLVALYPKEGTFWHEHPFGIVNVDWVKPRNRQILFC
jgi:Ca-activated chloride channel family protein